jgi:DNA repair protein RecO (recombination protein O)
MEWRDQGILLSSRVHGENSSIIEVLTSEHGRHLGVVRGGQSRKVAPILQAGAQIDVTWRARLEDHLGSYSVDLIQARAASVLSDRLALAALNAIVGLAAFSLPERAACGDFYAQTRELLDDLVAGTGWLPGYLFWEVALLDEMGLRLDLSKCAATGSTEDLAFVSPKTGRAVSRAAAGEWADRLLPLPGCLLGAPASLEDVRAGLQTTGFFLEHRLAPQ